MNWKNFCITARVLACAGLGMALPGSSPTRGAESPSTLRLVTVDDESGLVTPCRVHLKNAEGKAVLAPGFPAWKDQFVIQGELEMPLPAGPYTFEIERGPEFLAAAGTIRAEAGKTVVLTNRLMRIANLAKEGWWSGETHVHRALEDVPLLMAAEDLHVAGVISWWNNANPWARKSSPENTIVKLNDNRFYDLMGGEDERGGGALLYFGLRQPLNIAGSQREYPSPLKFLQEARQHSNVWVDIEKPFWWDAPVWLASGLADSIGIAHNHLQRQGMLDNEAWGVARDRQRYPSPHGNGLWTQDIYYHALNCGLRIPPSAGSASGVLPNPVGYNRAYVHIAGAPSFEKWVEGLRAGRVFVGNGPLLRVRANGQLPGHIFKGQGPIDFAIEGKLDARDAVKTIELVRNGSAQKIELPARFSMNESGWFLVRALADVPHTFRFASTGPFYVEIANQPAPVRRKSAEFFRDWVRNRIESIKLTDPSQKAEVLSTLREAEQFWQAKVAQSVERVSVSGEILDAETGTPLPARVYLENAMGKWFFPESTSPNGSAVRYEKKNWVNPKAVEFHTTLSAHPFRLELEPGTYTFTVERGKEYRPLIQTLEIGRAPQRLQFKLRRWVDMAARGWYSGDTHVHRSLAELPNVMLAEDVNVAFPLTYWVTKAYAPPTQGDKNTDRQAGAALLKIDDTHVIWPRNTEYEIFTVGGKRHTLGAVFILNHRTPFTLGAPPVEPIGVQARREGALLDLDKHDWPWSMMVVPIMDVGLFELANNHHWRTEFAFTNWSTPAPLYLGLSNQGRNGTELDWILYTFQNYYALLDCGFDLRPSAGTASGVHPVPLGFGRVYVHLPGDFNYSDWISGLCEGRSFVTTGPMLLATFNGQPCGTRFAAAAAGLSLEIEVTALADRPVQAIEIVVNGRVNERVEASASLDDRGAHQTSLRRTIRMATSGWVAVRCWSPQPDGRMRFAHTAPVFVDVPDQPLRPRKEEVEFLQTRIRAQLARSADLLSADALEEYRRALRIYDDLARIAR